ncbi:hypothetical protein B5F40_10210 [Gordonibacter sp. An230]|uniref:hypothetical protein n=1 Tax=Gordonibacter sp. An230 TaxID=1965592 RepID=UPI000B39ABDC|nr:hypothetical protein [Gordonibacter sp. An230]OUO89601.1 hypothetical protein B5F40_10210 [Gordonibacter sp. An230]
MSTVAPVLADTPRHAPRGRCATEIRVIAGGRIDTQSIPRHARVEPVENRSSQPAWTMAGAPYPLSADDRAFAVMIGIAFSIVSFASALA